jgi:hypothetical protein
MEASKKRMKLIADYIKDAIEIIESIYDLDSEFVGEGIRKKIEKGEFSTNIIEDFEKLYSEKYNAMKAKWTSNQQELRNEKYEFMGLQYEFEKEIFETVGDTEFRFGQYSKNNLISILNESMKIIKDSIEGEFYEEEIEMIDDYTQKFETMMDDLKTAHEYVFEDYNNFDKIQKQNQESESLSADIKKTRALLDECDFEDMMEVLIDYEFDENRQIENSNSIDSKLEEKDEEREEETVESYYSSIISNVNVLKQYHRVIKKSSNIESINLIARLKERMDIRDDAEVEDSLNRLLNAFDREIDVQDYHALVDQILAKAKRKNLASLELLEQLKIVNTELESLSPEQLKHYVDEVTSLKNNYQNIQMSFKDPNTFDSNSESKTKIDILENEQTFIDAIREYELIANIYKMIRQEV